MQTNKDFSTSVDSRKVALALLSKMVKYESAIDKKAVKSKAEERHVAFLRAFRVVPSSNK